MATQVEPKELSLQEQMANIRRQMDAADRDRADIRRIQAEIEQRQEEMARIRAETEQRQEDGARIRAEIDQRYADMRRIEQDMFWKPWQVLLTGFLGSAGLLGVGVAIGGLLVTWLGK